MVRSGRVLGLHVYRHYLSWARDIYSPDGWFLLGDAARSVDPLYSTGLSMTVLQVLQITEIIRRQRHASISADDIAELEKLWHRFADLHYQDITAQYAIMHDPFQACMWRYWSVCGWFNGFLTLWYNGFFTTPERARTINRLMDKQPETASVTRRLLGQVSRDLGPVSQADFDRAPDFDWVINPRFDCAERDLPLHVSRLFWKRFHRIFGASGRSESRGLAAR